MKKLIKAILILFLISLGGGILSSCRGSSAKQGAKLIEKASRAVKKNANHADDVYRLGKTIAGSTVACSTCNGQGTTNYHDCHICGGDGYFGEDICLTCNGTGRTNKCSKCGGTGTISSNN